MKKLKTLTLLTIIFLLVSFVSPVVYAKKDNNQGKHLGKEKIKVKQNNGQESEGSEKKLSKERTKTNTKGFEEKDKIKSPIEHLYLYEKNPSTGEIVKDVLGKITALTHKDKIIINGRNLETLSNTLINIAKETCSDNKEILLEYDDWLVGWSYRKSHTIVGSTAGAQTYYQVPIQVDFGEGVDQGNIVYLNGRCNLDFGDIRFTATDGTTELDYWIEKYEAGKEALFWVEIDAIPEYPQETTIYVYYGNEAALTTSSGEETFLLFSQDGLNGWIKESGDNWDTIDVGGRYGAVLSSSAADDDYDTIYRDFYPKQGFRYSVDTFFGVDTYGSWRYSYKVNIVDKDTGTYDDSIHLFYRVDDGTYKMDRTIYAYENSVLECSPHATETDPEYPYPKQWFTITLEVDGDHIRVYDDETTMENILWENDIQFSRIRLTSRREQRYEDNHRIMKLCNPEPNQTIWGSEETLQNTAADFDFVAQYHRRALTNDYTDIDLKISSLELVTASKNKAVFQGIVEIFDGRKFTFLLQVTNGSLEKTDHFFIKIWEGTETNTNSLLQHQSECT